MRRWRWREPRFPLLGEQRDFTPIIAVGDDTTDRDADDVDQQMPSSANHARVAQLAKVLLDRSHVSNSGHAFLRVRCWATGEIIRPVHLSKSSPPYKLCWSLTRPPWVPPTRIILAAQPAQ